MTGSTYIEIGLALSFLFLLLAVMTSMAAEVIARVGSWRARMLEEALAGLLLDPALTRRFYAHPLIRSLCRAHRSHRYVTRALVLLVDLRRALRRRVADDGLEQHLERWLRRRAALLARPSYVPSSLFAKVLLDLLRPAEQLEAALRAPPAQPAALDALREGRLEDLARHLEELDVGERRTLLTKLHAEAARFVRDPDPDREVDAGIELLPDRELRSALRALLARARHEGAARNTDPPGRADLTLTPVEAALARWFDDAMDRVSGWYKRRTRLTIGALAALLVVGLNLDTFYMADRIGRDQTLREVIVAESGSFLRSTTTPPTVDPQHPESPALTLLQWTATLGRLGLPIGWPTGDELAEADHLVITRSAQLAEAERVGTQARSVRDAAQARYQVAATEAERAVSAEREARVEWRRVEAEAGGLESAATRARAELASTRAQVARERLGDAQVLREGAKAELDAALAAQAAAARALEDASATFAELERRSFPLPPVEPSGPFVSRYRGSIVRVLGWIASIIAASLGAEFWFDAIGRLVTLREAGKRPDKAS